MNAEHIICTKVVRHKSNKGESLTHSKSNHLQPYEKIKLQIMDLINFSIENAAEKFLVEGLEIVNRDGPYNTDNYISTPNDIPVDLVHISLSNQTP